MRTRPESLLKTTVVVLLAANALYYGLAGTHSKALDACAWLLLLVLFLAETSFPRLLANARAGLTIRTLRAIAAFGVIAATFGYFLEDDMLDAANSALWIAVVALLELELRFPELVSRGRAVFVAAATLLYGALAIVALAWAVQGEWFDAYDAALWLAAFAGVELDVMRDRTPTRERTITPR